MITLIQPKQQILVIGQNLTTVALYWPKFAWPRASDRQGRDQALDSPIPWPCDLLSGCRQMWPQAPRSTHPPFGAGSIHVHIYVTLQKTTPHVSHLKLSRGHLAIAFLRQGDPTHWIMSRLCWRVGFSEKRDHSCCNLLVVGITLGTESIKKVAHLSRTLLSASGP